MRGLGLVLTCLLGLLLAGCGYHLRGGSQLLPPELSRLQLIGDTRSDLYRELALRLRRANVQLVTADESAAVLTLGDIKVHNEAASVDSRSQVVEYLMLFNTQVTLTVPEHEPQQFNVSFNRSFLNKSNQALASSREQEQLKEEMLTLTADQILLQLSRLQF
ncbi:MAG: LPS assembly lipoprotein LptE [Aeromonadaceae bacterium]|nr:LPS assembly lipoprotein LptE [Aeromonadaceae bacterium]